MRTIRLTIRDEDYEDWMLQEADYVAFFIKLPVFECDKNINACLHLFLKKYISLFTCHIFPLLSTEQMWWQRLQSNTQIQIQIANTNTEAAN